MEDIIPAKFLCTNCNKELILVKLTTLGKVELIGIDPCSCKGDISKRVKNSSNILSFSLEKERINLKKRNKK